MKTTWMALELMAAKASHHRISHKAIIIQKGAGTSVQVKKTSMSGRFLNAPTALVLSQNIINAYQNIKLVIP